MAIVWSRDPFLVRAGGGFTSAAGAAGEHTGPSRVRRRPLGSPTVLGPNGWRRWWTHHAAPGGIDLLTGTRSRATIWVCCACLLYEVSRPGMGTERSHAPG